MVSKSANYCQASTTQSTSLLLLSEVALGSMYECANAEYVVGPQQNPTKDQDAGKDFKRLPDDKHSTFGQAISYSEAALTVGGPLQLRFAFVYRRCWANNATQRRE